MNNEKAGPSLCFSTRRSAVPRDAVGSYEGERMASAGSAGSERQAFEALTREHLPKLYAFALRLTGEHAAAEDLVQETYGRRIKPSIMLSRTAMHAPG
jgi:Sigma-70 region 2